jgi:hypothetical protein
MPKRIPFFYWDVHRRIHHKKHKITKETKERGSQETESEVRRKKEYRRQESEDRMNAEGFLFCLLYSVS